MTEVMTQERTLEYALLLEQTQKNTIWQIVLRVQVQDHNMAQSICLLCFLDLRFEVNQILPIIWNALEKWTSSFGFLQF